MEGEIILTEQLESAIVAIFLYVQRLVLGYLKYPTSSSAAGVAHQRGTLHWELT